jgi:hypothetical protein
MICDEENDANATTSGKECVVEKKTFFFHATRVYSRFENNLKWQFALFANSRYGK